MVSALCIEVTMNGSSLCPLHITRSDRHFEGVKIVFTKQQSHHYSTVQVLSVAILAIFGLPKLKHIPELQPCTYVNISRVSCIRRGPSSLHSKVGNGIGI